MKRDPRSVADDFIERMGVLVEAEGLPRIGGRLMALLVLEGGPFSFADLAKRLRVSRASISTNSRFLVNLGILERVTRPGERQDYFQIAEHPYVRLMRGAMERMGRSRELVARTRAELPAAEKDAHRRLKELEDFYRNYISILNTVTNSK
jgi:DNA-binding transcriptional regulator GbsR (MarR family)